MTKVTTNKSIQNTTNESTETIGRDDSTSLRVVEITELFTVLFQM